MKYLLRLSISALAVGFSALTALAADPAPAAAPAAVPPPPRPKPHLIAPGISNVPDATAYLNLPVLLSFPTSQVALFNDRNPDIIFIGDSITQHWQDAGKAVWEKNFAPRNALDFGVNGDSTQNVLWRMDTYPIARFHPKLVVILIGTNNQRDTPAGIAAGVLAVIKKSQAFYPGVPIILNSIMPNRRNNAKMMAANTILRTYADDHAIYYLDLVPLMVPVGDNWKGLGSDHLHPDAAGYQLWRDALIPLLDKLMPQQSGA